MAAQDTSFSLPSNDVAWLKRDLLLFANSIGVKSDELHFIYVFHRLLGLI